MYDEFGNMVGPDPNGAEGEGDDFMDQEWINEMNHLQLGEDAPRQDQNDAPGNRHAQDSLVAYQGNRSILISQSVNTVIDVNDDPSQNQIVLHEDKQYYPDAEEVYQGAETLVQEEDAIPITTPIIAPVKKHDFDAQEKEVPKTTFNFEFLGNLSNKPDRIRNLAICGHLHHGKTLLMDMLVQDTHLKYWSPEKEHKYTDTRKDEQDRMLSIKAMPMSFVMQSSREKSYLVNVMDTPGHPNFMDEMA